MSVEKISQIPTEKHPTKSWPICFKIVNAIKTGLSIFYSDLNVKEIQDIYIILPSRSPGREDDNVWLSKNNRFGLPWEHRSLIPLFGRQRQIDIQISKKVEFQAGFVYIESSRPARDTQWDPVSKVVIMKC